MTTLSRGCGWLPLILKCRFLPHLPLILYCPGISSTTEVQNYYLAFLLPLFKPSFFLYLAFFLPDRGRGLGRGSADDNTETSNSRTTITKTRNNHLKIQTKEGTVTMCVVPHNLHPFLSMSHLLLLI